MSLPKETKVWVLNKQPTAEITSEAFRLETRSLPSEAGLDDGEIIVKVLAFGNDPALRGWMDAEIDPKRMYVPMIRPGDAITSSLMGEVVATNSKSWKVGQRVTAVGVWAEHCVLKPSPMLAEAFNAAGYSDYIALSHAGHTGWTAYIGIFEEMKLQKDHVLVVSGAAGATGSMVVQIAKRVVGCKRVIGIAGGKEKCDWVKAIGADDCIDYKDDHFAEHLKTALPEYADCYYDNVGGPVLDTMLTLVKIGGHIASCGAIAAYNGEPTILKNWMEVIMNRLNIKGQSRFLFFDYLDKLPKIATDLRTWLQDGTIQHAGAETILECGFDDVPEVWQKLFWGGNKGKLITKLKSHKPAQRCGIIASRE